MFEHIRILLAEDEAHICNILVEVLSNIGMAVDPAPSGDTAVRLIKAKHYALLISSISMPGKIDGIAVAAFARYYQPEIPVVFITGLLPELGRARKFSAPAICLAKPFSIDNVVNAIQELLFIPSL